MPVRSIPDRVVFRIILYLQIFMRQIKRVRLFSILSVAENIS
jgi:hypothetical protein